MTGETFAFPIGSRVQFKDGRNTRVGLVATQEAATEEYPVGYEVAFKIKETNQNRRSRIAASDLSAASEEFAFAIGEKVAVEGFDGKRKVSGEVIERLPIGDGRLEPQYGIRFKADNGMTDFAWWGEAILVKAA